jgi:hypothetical protein
VPTTVTDTETTTEYVPTTVTENVFQPQQTRHLLPGNAFGSSPAACGFAGRAVGRDSRRVIGVVARGSNWVPRPVSSQPGSEAMKAFSAQASAMGSQFPD